MVAREDVLWCYRNLLGREPESEAVVASHMESVSFKQLVMNIVRSAECVERMRSKPRSSEKSERFYPVDLKKNEVDVVATEEQLAKGIRNIKAAWTHLGITKPHFSVLTNSQFLPENIGGSIDKFWATGETEAARVQQVLEQHNFTDLSTKICVEYGCGVGRVTMGLAERFGQVHGYDISLGHLECAKQRAQEIGASNIFLHQCAEDFLADLEKCDFFYSKIVFQHNPPPIIALLIKKALKALNRGGIAIFQVPTYGFGYRFKLEEWLKRNHSLDMQMHCLPQEHIFAIIAEENCLLLEIREDNSTGAPERFISNTFVVKKLNFRQIFSKNIK